MYFANPWGLLGLALLPAIVFIHLYQRRFPPLEIGGLHLWASEEQTKTAGRRLDRLPITRSLLLELLAALLLTLLLARPQLSNLGSTTHWVFVLDNSASMMAADGNGQLFRNRALAQLLARVNSTGRNSRVSVILSGRRPTMLAGPAVRWPEAESALAAWQPQDTQHDFQSAWDMAAQLTEQSGKRVFITDDVSLRDRIPPSFDLVAVGEPLANLAFETARWSIEPESAEQNLYLRIRNYADRNVSAEIVGKHGGTELFRKSIEIEPMASLPFSTSLGGGLGSIRLSIESRDDRLSTDSNLQLIEPKLRTVHVAVTLPEDYPGRSQMVRVLRSLRGIALSDLDDADLVISPVVSELELPLDSWWLALGPVELDETSRKASRVTTGPFLIERRNSLLEGVNLQGVIWAGLQESETELAPMISVDTQVLFGQRLDLTAPAYLMNVDLSTSNLADSPDWPIMISNLIEACRNSRAGLRRWNYRVNEIIRFDIEKQRSESGFARPLVLRTGNGKPRNLVRARTVEIPALAAIGVYEVFDEQERIAEFAVNFFDREESDLSDLDSGTVTPEQSGESTIELAETAPWVWMLIIAVTMVVAVINWAGLRPKAGGEDGT